MSEKGERTMTIRVVTSNERKAIGKFFDRVRDTARGHFERDAFCEPVSLFLRNDEQTAVLPLGELANHKEAASLMLNKPSKPFARSPSPL